MQRRKLLGALLLSTAALGCAVTARAAAPQPLLHAHAHNDYEHPHPLQDALDHGFCSVEADIFLVDGKLLVGHTRADLRPERTLEALYLEPLRQRVRENGGRVYRGGPEVTLLIDIKTDGEQIYPTLRKTLQSYADLFTSFHGGQVQHRAVTAILSGERPRRLLEMDRVRYAGYDGRPEDVGTGRPASFMPWVSESWTTLFKWRGDGEFPVAERQKLREFVARAHAEGYKVRFWAAPDRPAVWKAELDAGVDLLSVDDLDGLQKFLLAAP